MASAFSDYVVCFHYSSNRNDHLTHSPRAGFCFHAPHHISDSSLTVELNRLFIATIVQPRIGNAPHPFVDTAAQNAAVSTRTSRRFL